MSWDLAAPPFHGGNRGSSPLGDATITRYAGFIRVIRLLNGPFVCLQFFNSCSSSFPSPPLRYTALLIYVQGDKA